MNFLKSVCSARSGMSMTHWNTSCCRDTAKSTTIMSSPQNLVYPQKPGLTRTENLQAKLCNRGVLYLMLKPAMWTQIRFSKEFNKDFPRFHRDMEFPSFEGYRKDAFNDVRKTKWGQGDEKGGATYLVALIGFCAGMYGTKAHLIHYLMSMDAPADVLAMASIEVDLSKVQAGTCASLKWRGKPLFVKNRTQAEIEREAATSLSELKDPQTPDQRVQRQEWLIVIGICTHLGCVPIANSGDFLGGFYCPCHGSHFDNVGRARKGPAPLNLVVPPYKFLTDTVVLVG